MLQAQGSRKGAGQDLKTSVSTSARWSELGCMGC